MKRTRHFDVVLRSTVVAVLFTTMLPVVVNATPPPWAPAHGWRRKHDPYYVGYQGKRWRDDYGVIGGSCNRAAVGAALGGVVGGAVGSTMGKGETRAVAIIVGTVLGAVVGHEIGREMDDRDRGCFGHSLELATTGHTVRWADPDGLSYALTPARTVQSGGRPCREFGLVTTYHGKEHSKRGLACRASDGVWRAE